MGTILYHYSDVRVPLLEQREIAQLQEKGATKKKDQAFHRGRKDAFELALQMVDISQRCGPELPGVDMRSLEDIAADLKQAPAGEPLGQAALDVHRETKPKKEKKNAHSKKKQ